MVSVKSILVVSGAVSLLASHPAASQIQTWLAAGSEYGQRFALESGNRRTADNGKRYAVLISKPVRQRTQSAIYTSWIAAYDCENQTREWTSRTEYSASRDPVTVEIASPVARGSDNSTAASQLRLVCSNDTVGGRPTSYPSILAFMAHG